MESGDGIPIVRKSSFLKHHKKNKEQDLKDVGLILEESEDPYVRRIDALTSHDIRVAFLLFLISSISVISISFIGPPYLIQKTSLIEISQINSSNRIFHYDLRDIHFFNHFLTLDLNFISQNSTIYDSNHNIVSTIQLQVSKEIQFYSGQEKIDSIQSKLKNFSLHFNSKYKTSDKLRLFTSLLINFDHLDCYINVKFLNLPSLPALMTWSMVDSAHTIFCMCLRVLFFLISILIVTRFYFLHVHFSKTAASIQMSIYLLINLILTSNPFIIFNYFTDSPVFRIIDSFLSQFFFVFCCFAGFFNLFISDKVLEPIDKSLALKIGIPFLIFFLIIFYHSLTMIFLIINDPIVGVNKEYRLLPVFKYFVISVFVPIVIIVSFIRRSDLKLDQNLNVFMIISLVLISTITESIAPPEATVTSNYALQIYTLAEAGIYCIFFSYFNWPVKKSSVNPVENIDAQPVETEEMIEVLNPEDEIENENQ